MTNKYIITIDGLDCTGKSTLMTKLNEKLLDSNITVQYRGILSNIAYGIKYTRNIYNMVSNYNKTSVNFIVLDTTFFNNSDINELFINRLKSHMFDEEKFAKDLDDYKNTINDSQYFHGAKEYLSTANYKGSIIYIPVYRSYLDNIDKILSEIYHHVSKSNLYTNDEIKDLAKNDGYAFADYDNFENKAHDIDLLSDYSTIVLTTYDSIDTKMNNAINELEEENSAYKQTYDYILQNTDVESIYDELTYLDRNIKDNIDIKELLRNYLENYNTKANIEASISTRMSVEADINVFDVYDKYHGDGIDYIYDNDDIINYLYEEASNNLRYEEIDDLEVDCDL